MTTIADVARLAGVSLSTVSHVLNGTRYVRPETAQAVRDAIASTGYTPNTLARSLARSTTNSVGIAISAISNPFFNDMIRAIERECAGLGLMVFLADTYDHPDRELEVVRALHQRRVDGIILAPCSESDRSALNYLRDNRIPSVLVDRLASAEFDQVGVQNGRSMETLVDHLADHGHRRIGLIPGQPGFATTRERTEGYRAALRRRGLDGDPGLQAADSQDVAMATASTMAMLRHKGAPTALVTGNNLATIGAMRGIRKLGLRVPSDIALAGFDDFDWADCFEPQLTVVAQPCLEIGRRAARRLLDRIKSPEVKVSTTRLKTTLVIRNSCGCHGAADAKVKVR